MKSVLLVFKNLKRNPARSLLSLLAVFSLAGILCIILSVLLFMNRAMSERSRDVKLVITERYRLPSRFDKRFMDDIVNPTSDLQQRLRQVPGFDPEKFTTWSFVGFTLDPDDPPKNRDLQFFVISTLPDKMPTMIDGLEEMDPKLSELMKNPPKSHRANRGVVMGPARLALLGKKVGDQFPARSISHRTATHRPIEMDFEIVGTLPADSRWAEGAFMDEAYLDPTLKQASCEFYGKYNLGWLQVDSQETAEKVAAIIDDKCPEVKCETSATAVSRFMAGYKGILAGVQYILVPAIGIVMILIVANAIGITVRERTREIAVLKVLGYSRSRVLALVLGEGLLIGLLGGLLSAAAVYLFVNQVRGGINLRIGFFPVFFVSGHALWWGPALGMAAALLGGLLPSWKACSVKVSEVFAKVA